jgi:putative ABC transport system permease protein
METLDQTTKKNTLQKVYHMKFSSTIGLLLLAAVFCSMPVTGATQFFGGILSVLAGYGISAFMLKTTKYLFSVASMLSVVEGVTFGIIICIACGLYPAWKVANLNPIDALRHE